MNVTQQMIDAMNELLVTLADTLDDEYSDVTADIFEQYELTDGEEEYCRDYYMSKHVHCSSCGGEFHVAEPFGFSHCADHKNLKNYD